MDVLWTLDGLQGGRRVFWLIVVYGSAVDPPIRHYDLANDISRGVARLIISFIRATFTFSTILSMRNLGEAE